MKTRVFHSTFSTLCLATIIGCGGGGSSSSNESSDVGQLADACSVRVFGGDQCPARLGPVTAVIGIGLDGSERTLCSGVFLSDRHVLTAAHCAPQESGGSVSFLQVSTGDRTFLRVGSIVTHPLFREADGTKNRSFDVAIATLDQPINATTLALTPPGTAIPLGTRVSLFGFGDNEEGQSSLDSGASLIAPKRADAKLLAEAEGILFLGSSSDGVCSGDSGGPAVLATEAGDLAVVGIASALIGESCSAALISIEDLDAITGGLPDAIRNDLLEQFPDGQIPRALYADLRTPAVAEFVRDAIGG